MTLVERYRRSNPKQNRIVITTIATTLALATLSWIIWSGIGGSSTAIDVNNTRHLINNENRTAEISWTVTLPTEQKVACALRALNENFGVVGWKVVELTPSSPVSEFTEIIHLSQPAATALVDQCWMI